MDTAGTVASFPADGGCEQLMDLGFVDWIEGFVFYGDVGCGKTRMAIVFGTCWRARDENRLDAELRTIGRARLLVIDELGYLLIDIDGARLLFESS